MKSRKICIIDDDEIYLFMMSRKLHMINPEIAIYSYSNGKKAARAFQNMEPEDLPDIIFLDINMPVMDGWEFMDFYNRTTTDNSKEISVYMVSSSLYPGDIHKAKEIENISGYLTKPVCTNSLQKIILNAPISHWADLSF